jgi:SAM-dependent methyltransferase
VDQREALQVGQHSNTCHDARGSRSIRRRLYSTPLSACPSTYANPQYHKGFRRQVCSWPSNPVSHYISVLSSYPEHTVIADLGCGDAALARALIPRGYNVMSFDLVSDRAFVIEADIFERLPLPGSEEDCDDGEESGQGHAQIVNVVVCALSLMGTNWPNCIREAWRILRPGCVLGLNLQYQNTFSPTPSDPAVNSRLPRWPADSRTSGIFNRSSNPLDLDTNPPYVPFTLVTRLSSPLRYTG